MFSSVINALKGAGSLLIMSVYTVVLCLLLCLLAIGKFLAPTQKIRDFISGILHKVVELWTSLNNFMFSLHRGLSWDIQIPETLSRQGSYLVSSNHQSWVDILALQKAFNRKIPMLTFFIKHELIYVPFLGAAWWALDFPFMKRPSREQVKRNPSLKGKDLENARKACEKFQHMPVAMMNFAEGTRFSVEKRDKTNSPYQNLLKPKVGGIGMVFYALGDKLQSVVDVTIAYPDGNKLGRAPTFWEMVTGQIPKIIVRARELEVPESLIGRNFRTDREIRKELDAWTHQVWQEKDALITELKAL